MIIVTPLASREGPVMLTDRLGFRFVQDLRVLFQIRVTISYIKYIALNIFTA